MQQVSFTEALSKDSIRHGSASCRRKIKHEKCVSECV